MVEKKQFDFNTIEIGDELLIRKSNKQISYNGYWIVEMKNTNEETFTVSALIGRIKTKLTIQFADVMDVRKKRLRYVPLLFNY